MIELAVIKKPTTRTIAPEMEWGWSHFKLLISSYLAKDIQSFKSAWNFLNSFFSKIILSLWGSLFCELWETPWTQPRGVRPERQQNCAIEQFVIFSTVIRFSRKNVIFSWKSLVSGQRSKFALRIANNCEIRFAEKNQPFASHFGHWNFAVKSHFIK